MKKAKLTALLSMRDYERAARKRLTRQAYDYYRSGAEEEISLRENERAFRRIALWPRILMDVAQRDLSVELFGERFQTPIFIAPTAYHRMAHRDGECGTARAAREVGALMVVSTLATTSLEDVMGAADSPKWFQLYVHKDRAFTEDLVRRADNAGYRALVVTVDTPLLGRRIRDERNGFGLPKGLRMENLVSMIEGGDVKGSELARYVADRHDAAFCWQDLAWLRSLTKLPILLKGVLRTDDAVRALELGVDGLIVSNHGARQLDSVPATIDALGPIAEAVGGEVPVMMDGGVRTGTDVLKALALGARAVFVGRPILWGLACDGEHGVRAVLKNLTAQLDRAMALAGCRNANDIPLDLVRPGAVMPARSARG